MAILGHGVWVAQDRETSAAMAGWTDGECIHLLGRGQRQEDSFSRRAQRRLVQRANRWLPGKAEPARGQGLNGRLQLVESLCARLQGEMRVACRVAEKLFEQNEQLFERNEQITLIRYIVVELVCIASIASHRRYMKSGVAYLGEPDDLKVLFVRSLIYFGALNLYYWARMYLPFGYTTVLGYSFPLMTAGCASPSDLGACWSSRAYGSRRRSTGRCGRSGSASLSARRAAGCSTCS